MYYNDFNFGTFLFLSLFTLFQAFADYATIVMKDIEYDETNLYIKEKIGVINIVPIRDIKNITYILLGFYRIRFVKRCPYPKKTVYFYFTFMFTFYGKEEVKELKKLMKNVKTN